MDAIFSAIPKSGRLYWSSADDLYKFCIENEGEELYIAIKQKAKTSSKMRMYAFLFGPVMRAAMQGYTAAGWEGIDKTKARYMLQAEFAKEDVYNSKTKEIKTTLEDIAGMSKARLLKFIVDVLFFLETELKQTVPD